MKRSTLRIALSLTTAALAVGAVAQEPATQENLLVTGSYSPRVALTSSVSVLDAKQIRALNKRTIAGLLKTLPGLLVEEQGGPGGLTAISIRGAEANFTLVLLDGVPVNDPTNFRGGGYDFANLSAALVERIEVVRGALSAIYGSDALAGVINIITRRPTEGHSQQLFVEQGEDDFSDLNISALGTLGELDYTLELANRDNGEPVKGSTRKSDSANLSLKWHLSQHHRLSASYRYLDGKRTSYPEQSGGPEYALISDLDKNDYQDKVLLFGWQADFSAIWRSTLNASRFQHEENYQSPGILPFFEVPPNAADTDFERDQLQWVNALRFGEHYRLNLGADYRHEDGDSEGFLEYSSVQLPTDFELDRDTKSLFSNLSVTPSDTLLLQGSLRYDEPDHFDSETSRHLGASYTLLREVTLAANWGEGFKLPSFFALGHALVGNPDLQPEKSRSWDLGVSWVASELLHLEATYFFNDFKDLVDFDPELFINVNRNQVETSGVELQAQWLPLPALSLQSQATYTDIDVKDGDYVLTGRPEWTVGVVAQWQINQFWSTVFDYQWTGEQYAASRHTGITVTENLDDFQRIDWVLHWQPSDTLHLQLSVDNLFNEKYHNALGFPGPGRALRLGIRFSHK